MATSTLLDEVIGVAEQYLGPAADRFVRRQIVFHLSKDPEALTSADLPRLAEWIKVSLGLLTEDKAMVDSAEAKILQLSR